MPLLRFLCKQIVEAVAFQFHWLNLHCNVQWFMKSVITFWFNRVCLCMFVKFCWSKTCLRCEFDKNRSVCARTVNRSCLNLPFLNAFISIQPYIYSFVHSFIYQYKENGCRSLHENALCIVLHICIPFKVSIQNHNVCNRCRRKVIWIHFNSYRIFCGIWFEFVFMCAWLHAPVH